MAKTIQCQALPFEVVSDTKESGEVVDSGRVVIYNYLSKIL